MVTPPEWFPWIAAAGVGLLVLIAEVIHLLRCRRVSALAFGDRRYSRFMTCAAVPIRILACSLLTWGLLTLWFLPSEAKNAAKDVPIKDRKHIVLVLDVSPSMRLQDAGPDGDQSRKARAADVMESFFRRVILKQYQVSCIAVYNQAKPIVVDTSDMDVVRNILSDLPVHFAFKTGQTDLFAGLEEAAKVTEKWYPKSTTVILVSDGDTVPPTGMPKMPPSVRDVLVVGVGDARKGAFINGKNSRQDTSQLRQIALRLRGEYHNANERHLASSLVSQVTSVSGDEGDRDLSKREWALVAICVGAFLFAGLPLFLDYLGTFWRPGVPMRRVAEQSQQEVRELVEAT